MHACLRQGPGSVDIFANDKVSGRGLDSSGEGRDWLADKVIRRGLIAPINLWVGLQDGSSLQFSFDKVHGFPDGAHNSQADIFSDVQDIVLSVLQGLNGCIMAYGQTGLMPQAVSSRHALRICAVQCVSSQTEQWVVRWRECLTSRPCLKTHGEGKLCRISPIESSWQPMAAVRQHSISWLTPNILRRLWQDPHTCRGSGQHCRQGLAHTSCQ